MEITAKLVSGNEVKGYIVNDCGETYPILVESLHSKVIFDSLVESGYEFCGLPYDFRKDGESISQLPATNYNPTPAEEQDMFDMLDADMYNNDELRSKVVQAKVTLVPEPETEYTITTREDFLKFLNSFDNRYDFAPSKPINSFVAPKARFTVEEFINPANSKYVEKLNSYRKFSFARWKKFLAWAGKDFPDYNSILRFYYQWGLDGLYLPVLSKNEKNISVPLNAVFSGEDRMSALFSKKEIGVIDRAGTILVPEESKGLAWEPVYSREYVETLKEGLKGNQTAVLDLKAYTKELCITFESFNDTLKFTLGSINLGNYRYPGISVYPNGFSNPAANPDTWIPSKLDEMADRAYMQALAKDTLIQRIEPCTGTTARALDLLGCSRKGIIRYVVAAMGADKESATNDGDVMNPITPGIVNAYCEGKLENGQEKDFLDGILDGTYNLDAIHAAETARMRYSTEKVYEQIYVLHKIFKLSIDEIRDKIMRMGEDPTFTVTRNDGYEFTFDQPINRNAFKAFNADVQSYRTKAASEATEYIYITQAVRELGSAEAKRHVAFIGYSMTTYTTSAKFLLEFIKDKFTAKVEEKCAYKAEQARWLADVDYFAATRAFEIALKGTLSYPSGLGGEKEVIDPDMVQQFNKQIKFCTDMLTAVTEANVFDNSFKYLFVNAYVTPTQVIPIKNAKIEQIDLSANWSDFRQYPDVYQKLIAKGAIQPNSTPMELYAADPNYMVTEHDMNEGTDLYSYYIQSQEWRSSVSPYEEFVSAPHPTEYLTPALYVDEEEEEEKSLSDTPLREGAPKFSVLPIKTLTIADFEDYLDISGETEKKSDIQPFYGLDSTDFYMLDTPLSAIDKATILGHKSIIVQMPDTIYIGDSDAIPYRDIATKVGDDGCIVNICGRKYIFRDNDGNTYFVEV